MSQPSRTRAAALAYDAQEDAAPRLVARGAGATAEAILELARRHGVPVRSDPALASLLAVLEIGDEVPPELYEAVARLVACLVELDLEHGGRRGVDGALDERPAIRGGT